MSGGTSASKPLLISLPQDHLLFCHCCIPTTPVPVLQSVAIGTPIFAAIVNRINEERLTIGKGPVGFISPVLYANPGVLNDIKNGSNPGCGTNGFDAVEGWDPLTGLGTPNYIKMLELFLGLP